MNYELISDYRENKHYNNDFLNLIKKSGKSCLEDWMTKGHWDDNYIPFALVNPKGDIIANIGAIKFSLFINKTKYNAVQLGQLLIRDGYENDHLEEKLLEMITNKYENIVDIIYTYDSELTPYLISNLGFQTVAEVKYFKKWNPNHEPSGVIIKKIDTEASKDLDLIQTEIKHSTRMSSAIATSGDSQIKLFNILRQFRKNVYSIPSLDAIAVFSFTDGLFQLAGVYSKNNIDINELLDAIVPTGITKIEFGFIPDVTNLLTESYGYKREDLSDSNHLALKSISAPKNIDGLLVPLLSRWK